MMFKSGEYKSVIMTSHNIVFSTDYDIKKEKENYDYYWHPVKV